MVLQYGEIIVLWKFFLRTTVSFILRTRRAIGVQGPCPFVFLDFHWTSWCLIRRFWNRSAFEWWSQNGEKDAHDVWPHFAEVLSKQWVPWKMIICLRRCLFDHDWKLGSTNLPGSLSSLCALICRLLASCSISCLDFHQVVCLLSSVVQTPLLSSHYCWATLRFIAISTFIGSYGVFAAISWFWLAASFVNTIISVLPPLRAVILCLRRDFLLESLSWNRLSGQRWRLNFFSACFCSETFFSCLLVCAAGLRSSDYCLGRPLCLGLYFSLALLRLSLFCSRLASLASAIMLSWIFCHLVVLFIRRVDMTIAIGTLGHSIHLFGWIVL